MILEPYYYFLSDSGGSSSTPASGNADKVDGYDVDNSLSSGVLWTADKIISYTSSTYAPLSHTHHVSDIVEFPDITTGAGKVVKVKSDGSGFEYVDVTTTDEKVKVDSSDTSSGYLSEKVQAGDGVDITTESGKLNIGLNVDTTYFYFNSGVLTIKNNIFAPYTHTHSLSDISDFPTWTSSDVGRVLRVDSSGNLTWAAVSTTDEKVKADSSDTTPGYLSDKVDNTTIKVVNHKLRVADGVINADKVDGYDVDDSQTTGVLWTADKVQSFFNTQTISWNRVDKTGSKLSDLDDVPNYTASKFLFYDGTNIIWKDVDWSDIVNKPSSFPPTAHIHTWSDVDKTGSKLSDISDVPDYTGNANKFLRVNSTEDGIEYADIDVADEKVKASPTDPNSGYLSDKVDNVTIIVENNKLKVKDDTFAPSTHTHTWSDVDKSGSKLSDIEDVPSYTGNAGKVLAVKSDESGVEWITVSGGGTGATTFLELTDTPSSYSGQAGKVLVVNSSENGLVFSTILDEKVKASSSDSSPGYLVDKVDNNTIVVESDKLKVKDGVFAPATHTHTWNEINKTGSKLSDIEDVPDYTGNAGKVLRVNSTENGIEFAEVNVTDEKVKINSTDPTPGYLADKIDNNTIIVDGNVIKVDETKFASSTHTHTWSEIDKAGSKLSDIGDIPDYTGNAGKFLRVKSTEDGIEYVDVPDERVKLNSADSTPGYLADKIDNDTIIVDGNVIKVNETKFAPATHTHTWSDIDKTNSKLSDLSDVPDYSGNAGKALVVNSTEDGIEYVAIPDEKVKTDPSDTTSGYLVEKFDPTYFSVDPNHRITLNIGTITNIDDATISDEKSFSSNKTYELAQFVEESALAYTYYLSTVNNLNEYVVLFPSDITGASTETGYVIIGPSSE